MKKTKDMIRAYEPRNEQEAMDKRLIMEFLDNNDDALIRDNLAAHITSSAFVVNEAMDKIVFVHHNIYNSWSWVGGHNDGDDDLLHVAIKEAGEETGIKHIRPHTRDIFTLDVIYVQNHIKHGVYVPDHLHLNAAFLLIASEEDPLIVNPEENSGVRWFDLDIVLSHVSEARMMPVYQKAFDAIAAIRGKA